MLFMTAWETATCLAGGGGDEILGSAVTAE